jgi:transcriptional regulator with XRE-family HTH domain
MGPTVHGYADRVTMEAIFANRLEVTRQARGLSSDELARSAGLDPSLYDAIESGAALPSQAELKRLIAVLEVRPAQLYPMGLIGAIGLKEGGVYEVSLDDREFYRELRDPARLFVSPEEMTWLERASTPEGACDVFVNMSCGTQMHPHLMLDTAAVLRALGVNFAAGAGADFCCGGYFRINHSEQAGARVARKSVQPALARGARTHVSWCTSCVNNFTALMNRRAVEDGTEAPLREMQILDFLAERLETLGDDVPWVRPVDRKVVIHSHPRESPIVAKTTEDLARVLRLVPGVQVVGSLDRTFMDNFCYPGIYKDLPPREYPETPLQMQAMRHEIAAIANSLGADTVSPQHQDCSRLWAAFASTDMAVRHAVSIVAEALGCDHPDRVQAAYMLGDPDAVVEQTRPIWSAWGLSEDQARTIARREYKPAAAAEVAGCRCGSGTCGRQVGRIDVLRGVNWRSAVDVAAREG